MKKILSVMFLAAAIIFVGANNHAAAQSTEFVSPEVLRVDEFTMHQVYSKPWTIPRAQVMTGVVVNCREWITLRDEPSVYGADLAHMPLGAQLLVYDGYQHNGFYAVKFNGINGFALVEYIRITGAG